MRNRILVAGIVIAGASASGATLAAPPEPQVCLDAAATAHPDTMAACLRRLPCPEVPRAVRPRYWDGGCPALHY